MMTAQYEMFSHPHSLHRNNVVQQLQYQSFQQCLHEINIIGNIATYVSFNVYLLQKVLFQNILELQRIYLRCIVSSLVAWTKYIIMIHLFLYFISVNYD